MQRAMLGMGTPGGDRNGPLRLQEVLTPEAIISSGVLNDPEVRASLIEHPQFRQSLGALTAALHSENFNSVVANFDIDPTAGMSHLVRYVLLSLILYII
jgi:hypothetical protein